MKQCPDTQINASFIDILRIKWLVFLLRSSFFRTTSTFASSEAPAYKMLIPFLVYFYLFISNISV